MTGGRLGIAVFPAAAAPGLGGTSGMEERAGDRRENWQRAFEIMPRGSGSGVVAEGFR